MLSEIIELSEKQEEVWRLLDLPEVLEVFGGGGAGGGKSMLGCTRQIWRRTQFVGTRGFIGRESFTGLRDSTMNTYFELMGAMKYRSIDHYTYNAQEHTVYWKNGTAEHPPSEQHFRHMAYMPSDPDYNRFGSTEYTDGFVDEAPEVEARACQVLLSRLRYRHQEHGITPELLYTGNPGESWIKDQFVMDAKGNMIDLPAHRRRVLFTIEHNPNEALRKQYISTLEKLDAYDQARLLHGDWSALPNVLRPFAFAFDRKKHVRPFTIDQRAPVWVWVDFNLDPFTTLIAQRQGNTFGVSREVSVSGGTMQELAQRIKAVVPNVFMHQYTGDRSGAARRIQAKSTASMWDDLLEELGAREAQLDLPANPTHKKSREDTNYALHHLDIAIDPSCTGLIYDLERVEVDADLSIIKSDRSKESQRADFLDCFVWDTPVLTSRGDVPIANVRVGDLVWTRKGWKPVIDQWCRGEREVYEYTLSDGRTISCTSGHHFYTNVGWRWIRDVYLEKLQICSLSSNTEAQSPHTGPLFVVSERRLGLRPVFDITVSGAPEFFANGILAHNCFRYGVNTYLSHEINIHRRLHAVRQPTPRERPTIVL